MMSEMMLFLSGIVCGTVLTVLWYNFIKPKKTKQNDTNDEVKNEYESEAFLKNNKLVLVVRNDLKMGKGKVASQCCHAAVLAYDLSRKKCPSIFANWRRNGQPKIVVKVNSEEEMLELAQQAKKSQLLVNIVQDAGKTQIAPGSKTVLAVGPGPEGPIDEVRNLTGNEYDIWNHDDDKYQNLRQIFSSLELKKLYYRCVVGKISFERMTSKEIIVKP